MRNISDRIVERIKVHVVFSIPFSENPAFFGDKEKNYFRARQVTGDNVMWTLRFAFWITKARYTHLDYVIFLAFHGTNNYSTAFKFCVKQTLSC